MCNSTNCPHGDDLNDDLDGLFEGPAMPLVPSTKPVEIKGDAADALMRSRFQHEPAAAVAGHRYTEPCPKCNGSGRFVGYTGRVLGNCFECKGKGTKTFKTSPEARAKAQHAAERKREQKAASLRDNVLVWKEENQADWDWMHEAAPRFDFAASMIESLHKYGALTDKQHAAVVRMREQSEARQAQWAAEKAARDAAAPTVEIAKIEQAFATARASGLERLKLRLSTFVFSPAPETGRNAGAIYVKDSDVGTYLGKVQNGRFHKVRECTAEEEQRVLAAIADPSAAANAYGLKTGRCSCCGAKLTAKESVERSIGPICAAKWGL